MQLSAFCGLGQAAAVPILTGLRFFRDEFVAHAGDKKCHTGVCGMRGEPVVMKKKMGARNIPLAA